MEKELIFYLAISLFTVLVLPSAFLWIGKDNTQHAICFLLRLYYLIGKQSFVGGPDLHGLREEEGKVGEETQSKKSCPRSSI